MAKIEDLKKIQELYPKGCVATIYFAEEDIRVLKTEAGAIEDESKR